MLLKIVFKETVAFDAVHSVWDTSKQAAKMQKKNFVADAPLDRERWYYGVDDEWSDAPGPDC